MRLTLRQGFGVPDHQKGAGQIINAAFRRIGGGFVSFYEFTETFDDGYASNSMSRENK
ncbi:MAG: hypothetical protein ACYSUT_02790 [Planctomycetota bacterium]